MVRIGGGDGAAPPQSPGATKKYRLEFYAQAFNLLNHANLGAFSGVQTSPFFGQATSAQSPRGWNSGLCELLTTSEIATDYNSLCNLSVLCDKFRITTNRTESLSNREWALAAAKIRPLE
jgi:hypothetical protein